MSDNFANVERAIELLRSKVQGEIVDYGFALSCLSDWASPRGVLARLLKSGHLIQIKRGFYLFGPLYRKGEIPFELLANQLWGPSYVSLEWMLDRYGLIPEKTHEVTSVTTKRRRLYTCDVGRFSYAHIHVQLFSVGVELGDDALVAGPEKALADLLVVRRGRISSMKEIERILFDDLRIDEQGFSRLHRSRLEEIVSAYPHSALRYLLQFHERTSS